MVANASFTPVTGAFSAIIRTAFALLGGAMNTARYRAAAIVGARVLVITADGIALT